MQGQQGPSQHVGPQATLFEPRAITQDNIKSYPVLQKDLDSPASGAGKVQSRLKAITQENIKSYPIAQEDLDSPRSGSQQAEIPTQSGDDQHDHPTTMDIIRKGFQVFADKKASDLAETYKKLQAALKEREEDIPRKKAQLGKEWDLVRASEEYKSAVAQSYIAHRRLKSYRQLKQKDDDLELYCSQHEKLIDLAFERTKQQFLRIIQLQATDKRIHFKGKHFKSIYKHLQTPSLMLKTLPIVINVLITKHINELRTIKAADLKIRRIYERSLDAEKKAYRASEQRWGQSEVSPRQKTVLEKESRAARERFLDFERRIAGMVDYTKACWTVYELVGSLWDLSWGCKAVRTKVLDRVKHVTLANRPTDDIGLSSLYRLDIPTVILPSPPSPPPPPPSRITREGQPGRRPQKEIVVRLKSSKRT